MEELREGARHSQAHPARAEAANEAVIALAPDTAVEHVYTQSYGECPVFSSQRKGSLLSLLSPSFCRLIFFL